MLKITVSTILIWISGPAWAAPGLDVRPEAGFSPSADPQPVKELSPNFDDLRCEAKCDGAPVCGTQKNMDSCLKADQSEGCFWSCG
jgi:hypothetical protein